MTLQSHCMLVKSDRPGSHGNICSPMRISTLNVASLCFVIRIMHCLPEKLLESIKVNMILTARMMDSYCCIQEWCQFDSRTLLFLTSKNVLLIEIKQLDMLIFSCVLHFSTLLPHIITHYRKCNIPQNWNTQG